MQSGMLSIGLMQPSYGIRTIAVNLATLADG
jgi:hypothetical protein